MLDTTSSSLRNPCSFNFLVVRPAADGQSGDMHQQRNLHHSLPAGYAYLDHVVHLMSKSSFCHSLIEHSHAVQIPLELGTRFFEPPNPFRNVLQSQI